MIIKLAWLDENAGRVQHATPADHEDGQACDKGEAKAERILFKTHCT